MLGWKLWRQISRGAQHPPENPAHRRLIGTAPPPMPFALECAMLLMVPVIMLPALVFTTAVYGLRWVALISQTIAREQTSGRFDLLALTPGGGFGTAWMLACGAIQRTGMLYVLETPFAWLLRGFLMLIVFTATTLFAVTGPLASPPILLGLIFTYVLLIVALVIDHAHSVGLAVLVGLLAPAYTTRTADAGLLALTTYTMLQLTTYAITGLVGFALLPDIFTALNVSPPVMLILLPLLRVAILLAIREVLITYLWTLVQQQYQAEPQDVGAVDLPVTTFETLR
jgi:hypothetical protein